MATILRRLSLLRHHRYFSSPSAIPSDIDSIAVLGGYRKSRAAIKVLKKETNPEKIIEICQAADLKPYYPLDRTISLVAIAKLRDANYFEGIRSFIEQFWRFPEPKCERFASHAIVLYGHAGMIQNAITTFENLEESGIERSVKTLNALILACILAKNCDEARRVFVDFPERYGIKPDVSTYNYMIKAFSESGSASSGYSMVSEMEKAGLKPDNTTFSNMLEGFYAEEKFEDVENVLKMMKDRNLEPCLTILNTRIKSLCKLRRTMEAKALLESTAYRKKVSSLTYTHLVHGFGKEGNLEEAKQMFLSMVTRKLNPTPACYLSLIHHLTHGGDYETAYRRCKELMYLKRVPSFKVVKMLVEGLARVFLVHEARELIGQMKDKFPGKEEELKEIEDSLPA